MRVLIGIDDTDNATSRGTGFKARELGSRLAAAGLVRLRGISRHQLFVHEAIPYTSHNSSLCLDGETSSERAADLVEHCRRFLRRESAAGSDAGLCIVPYDDVPAPVVAFGRAAKHEVVERGQAERLGGAGSGLHLEGLTGDWGGIIGALAAVGLRRSGDDGRFVWLAGARELSGRIRARDLITRSGIDIVRDVAGGEVAEEARICVDPWPRAVVVDDRAVLLVTRAAPRDGWDWQLLTKEEIRRF